MSEVPKVSPADFYFRKKKWVGDQDLTPPIDTADTPQVTMATPIQGASGAPERDSWGIRSPSNDELASPRRQGVTSSHTSGEKVCGFTSHLFPPTLPLDRGRFNPFVPLPESLTACS